MATIEVSQERERCLEIVDKELEAIDWYDAYVPTPIALQRLRWIRAQIAAGMTQQSKENAPVSSPS